MAPWDPRINHHYGDCPMSYDTEHEIYLDDETDAIGKPCLRMTTDNRGDGENVLMSPSNVKHLISVLQDWYDIRVGGA